MLLPALVLLALFTLWPLWRVSVLAMEDWDGYSKPAFVGFRNFADLWQDPGFVAEVQHSAVWLVVTLSVPVILGSLLALLVQATPAPLRDPVRAALIVPLVLSTTVTAVAWRLFFNPLSGPLTSFLELVGAGRLAGDWLGDPRLALPSLLTIACWGSYGISMLICEAGLSRLDADVMAAARLDGAGSIALFRAITLPALRDLLPLAVVATGFCAIPTFDLVSMITNGGPGYATTTLALDSYGRAFGGAGQVGQGAALALLQSLVGVVLALAALLVARGRGQDEPSTSAAISGPRRAASLLAAILAPVVACILLAPVLWLTVLALRGADGAAPLTALATNLSSIADQGFGGALVTSTWSALVVAAATTAAALPVAYALAASRSRWLHAAAAAVLAVGLFQPSAVLIIPLFNLIRSLGLLDSAAGFILPQIGRSLDLGILLLWIAIRGLPRELIEAATIDGASPEQALARIILPLIAPLVSVVGVWSFLVSWNDYLLPLVALAGSDAETVPLALAHFSGRFDTEYGQLATGTLVTILPAIAVFAMLYYGIRRGASGLSIAP